MRRDAAVNPRRIRIDFERALKKGERSYDTVVGEWWKKKSRDSAHQRAYKNIALFIKWFLIKQKLPSPQWIVDYACGNGAAQKFLLQQFPDARLIGLDGSQKMLKTAREDLEKFGAEVDLVVPEDCFKRNGPQVRLVHVSLPCKELPARRADLVVFLFPNINFTAAQNEYIARHFPVSKEVEKMATFFGKLPEKEGERVTEKKAREAAEDLLAERAISSNIHHLLKKGRYFFKADYANTCREKLEEETHWKMLFSECAFSYQINRKIFRDSFDYVGNRYFRSKVILDVYDQTQDPDDKTGGYILSAFRAR